MVREVDEPGQNNLDDEEEGDNLSHLEVFFDRLRQAVPASLRSRTPFRLSAAALLGVAAGYGSILFRILIEAVRRVAFADGSSLAKLQETAPWHLVAAPLIGGCVVGPMVYFLAREAEGHGIPEVKLACANQGGRIRARVAIVKILASAITIGSGGSVGREGPIAQIGASVGSFLGQRLRLSGQYLVDMVASGAGAGIAATFNAPIAGVVFALEIILERTSARHFSQLVVCTVVAEVVAHHYQGDVPAFRVPPYTLGSGWELALYALLGILAAPVGVAFSLGVTKLEVLWARFPLPRYTQAALGGAIVGTLAIWFPQLIGVGYEHIENVLAPSQLDPSMGANWSLAILALLIPIKILAAGVTLASGGSGGIFAPALFLGASLGGAFGRVAERVLPARVVASPGAYALVGMGAVVAAAMHAPLTAMLIVFELTDRHAIILPLMLACMISTVLAFRLSRESIFTLALTSRGKRLKTAHDAELVGTTKVRTLIDPTAPTVRPNASLLSIVERAADLDRPGLFVTTASKRLLGEVTLEDVGMHVQDEESVRRKLRARDLMHPVAAVVQEDDTVARCVDLLAHPDIDQIPVLDQTKRLVGSVSRADIMAFMSREILRRDAVLSFVEGDAVAAERRKQLVRLPTGEFTATVDVDGPMINRSLRDLNLRVRYGVNVYGVRHPDGTTTLPQADRKLGQGDSLLVVGPEAEVEHLREKGGSEEKKKPSGAE